MRTSAAATVAVAGLLGLVALTKTGGAEPNATASPSFWKAWGDGKAELSGYTIVTSRYGAPREGKVVLIYVTEPMDRRSWIKDDAGDVPAADRVNVLKLNHVLKFQTGIYPYSVMTSVFSPVDGTGADRVADRFAPVKITMSAQEWCGHVYQCVMPGASSLANELRSYFHADGNRNDTVKTPPGVLYEDALLIQFRELDGPFAGGKAWSGTVSIIPSLWRQRKRHAALLPVPASIRREDAVRDNQPVTRFAVMYSGVTTTYDIEKAAPRRVLGWKSSDGEEAKLLKTARLPYWQLNSPGDERYLRELGL